MMGYRTLLGRLSHSEWADHWQRSYKSACELMHDSVDNRMMRGIKRSSLALMARHIVERDRELSHGPS